MSGVKYLEAFLRFTGSRQALGHIEPEQFLSLSVKVLRRM